MAFKVTKEKKVIQITPPHVVGDDAKRMLSAKIPKAFIEKIKNKKFITEVS